MPIAAALLLCAHHGLRWPRVSRADMLDLLKLGIAGHLIHVGMVTYGIHWSTAFSSSLILACGPVFTLLILRWYGLETLSRAQVVGVGIALAGVLVFLSDKLLGGQWRASGGDLFLLVAASFFSYYTVAAKPLIERHGGVVVMTYGTLLGSAPVVAVSLPAGLQVHWAEVPPLIWVGMLYAVLISAFLGWLVWGWVNAVRGVARTAPLMYLMPPVAALVAWLVTGERYTTIKLLGAAIDAERGSHTVHAVPYGTDAATLAWAGIPSVVFGPGDIAKAHTVDEWVPLDEVETAANILYRLACTMG
jgi:drug/metabolite transporter (DMT)-like permease